MDRVKHGWVLLRLAGGMGPTSTCSSCEHLKNSVFFLEIEKQVKSSFIPRIWETTESYTYDFFIVVVCVYKHVLRKI